MAKSNASEMLTSLDSLFTTQEQRDEAKRDSVQDIPISQISDFPEHPFKVKQDEAMADVQAMIDALPDAAELDGMDDEALDTVYEAFQTACDAYYDTLTEEQQAQLERV